MGHFVSILGKCSFRIPRNPSLTLCPTSEQVSQLKYFLACNIGRERVTCILFNPPWLILVSLLYNICLVNHRNLRNFFLSCFHQSKYNAMMCLYFLGRGGVEYFFFFFVSILAPDMALHNKILLTYGLHFFSEKNFRWSSENYHKILLLFSLEPSCFIHGGQKIFPLEKPLILHHFHSLF